jgi:hypothetical protein
MSAGYFQAPHPVVTNGDMSGNIIGKVILKPEISGMNYSVVFTGSPTGTFTIEASDDYSVFQNGTVNNPGTWNTLPTTPAVVASGAGGNGMIEVVTIAYATRLVYTRVSGTGTLNAIVTGQGV